MGLNINNLKGLIENLKKTSLPGQEAHKCLIPLKRSIERYEIPQKAQKGSVVLLLFPVKNEINILFIERTKNNDIHSGQIAFPGGKFSRKEGDVKLINTAIRELKEEVGVDIKLNNVIKELTPLYIFPSNFIVSSFVAVIDYVPTFKLSYIEVEKIIKVPLEYFISSKLSVNNFKTKNGIVKAPCFKYKNILIWGATAMILNELLFIIRKNI